MPVYTYRGTNRAGSAVSGEVSATSNAELQNILRRQQITATKMSEKGKEFNLPTFGATVKAKELAVFTRQFSVMIDAGLPLVQCLEILAGQQENKLFQKVLTGTRSAVEGGATLSAAMRQFPKVFDTLYVNMVEAGETGGILDTILQRLSQYIEKNVKLQRAVKSALVYPVGVLTVAASVITLLLWKVVPIFATLFAGLGVTLPLPTRIVIGLSNFVASYFGLAIFFGLVAAIVGVKIWYGTPQGRYIIDAGLLKAPVIGLLLQDCGGAFYPHARDVDCQRCPDPGGVGHYRENGGKCGCRAGPAKSPAVPRRRQIPHRAIEGIRSISWHGYTNDCGRRADRCHGCDVAENCRFLRRRSGCGGEGHVDSARADHDRISGFGGRRSGYLLISAALLAHR